jgi:predicted NAD-dependent protein-ADP-ribosyltransferase YbiA (DUF1768 family)
MKTPVYFYATNERYGEVSNFAKFGIGMDDLWWRTGEHYFQAQKFTIAAGLAAISLATGKPRIVENAPGDSSWGCGKFGNGKKMLGKILMETRDLIKDA